MLLIMILNGIQLVTLLAVIILAVPYGKWSYLLQKIVSVQSVRAYVDSMKYEKGKSCYHVIFSYDGERYSMWLGEEIGNCSVRENIDIVPMKLGSGLRPYSIKYVVNKCEFYASVIMAIMFLNAAVAIITKYF